MAKNRVGRPPIVDKIAIQKLEQAFSNDLTDLEACLYAGISKSTLYNYQEKHPEFVERKELLKNALSLKAKNNMARKINEGDEESSRWWLERRRKQEFSLRTEQTGADGKDLSISWPLPQTVLDEIHTATSIPAVPHEEPEVVLPSLPPSRR